MTATTFPEANTVYRPPADLEESQCSSIAAFQDVVQRGSCEGTRLIVVAWQPSERELEDLKAGGPVFLSMLGGLQPHFLTTRFEEAVCPA